MSDIIHLKSNKRLEEMKVVFSKTDAPYIYTHTCVSWINYNQIFVSPAGESRFPIHSTIISIVLTFVIYIFGVYSFV